MVGNRVMDKWHNPVLVLLILNSIALYLCKSEGNANETLGYLDNFSEEHTMEMVRYFSAKKKYQTVLEILPDLHRLHPSSEALYVMGAAITWRLAHPDSESSFDLVPHGAALTNRYILKFVESFIGTEDKETALGALHLLVRRVAAAKAEENELSEEMFDSINEIIKKWIPMYEDEQVVPASTSSQIDSDDESKKVP